MESVKKKDM